MSFHQKPMLGDSSLNWAVSWAVPSITCHNRDIREAPLQSSPPLEANFGPDKEKWLRGWRPTQHRDTQKQTHSAFNSVGRG
jgi:hypothetical protein